MDNTLPREALEAVRTPTTEMMVMLVMRVAESVQTGRFGIEEATKAWRDAIGVALEKHGVHDAG